MTEMQRHRMREVLRCYAISFGISLASAWFMPGGNRVHPLIMACIFGFTFGSFVLLIGAIAGRLRHRSFIVSCLMQAVAYLAIVVLAFGTGLLLFVSAYERASPFSAHVRGILVRILSNPMLQLNMGIAWVCMFVISSIFQISKKLGPGVLWNWMTGRYHEPREETRIFMFLDLKDSTRLAEKLGNIRFSSLVRDFFSDLTKPVIETRCEVSHYIGDEAVLTWRPERGLPKANCIEIFFKMKAQIATRAKHYLDTYGVVPEFKAGVHIGPVVATEVGDVKSEIVYHGDVLNTAARIQSHCNELDSDLLVSEDLVRRLDLPARLAADFKGNFLFKGKEHEVGVYAVHEGAREDRPVVPSEPEKVHLV